MQVIFSKKLIRSELRKTDRLFFIILILITGFLPDINKANPARLPVSLPTYQSNEKLLPDLWIARYPVMAESFIPNPAGKGILRASVQGKFVYYYQYNAILPVQKREEDHSITTRNRRKAEFWLRYRPSEKEPFDITFARSDLLPGINKTWIPSK